MRVNFGNIGSIGDKTVITGSASGLDTKSIIDATVTAKEIPINKLKDVIELDNKKIIAYNQLNTLLTAFNDAADSLRNPPQFDKSDDIFSLKQVSLTSNSSVSANTYIGIAASNLASVDNYQISDVILATAHSQYASGFPNNTGTVTTTIATAGMFKAGTFKINNIDITINNGDNLVSIQSKINATSNQTNVTANIIRISSANFQLVLKSNNAGINNAYVINDSQSCLSNISWTNINATDTSFTFNNIPMTRSTNSVNDVVQGVTFNFYQNIPPGTTINAAISYNPAAAEQAVTKFIGCYNDLKTFNAQQTERDLITNKFTKSAILGGDLFLANICNSIENELMRMVKGINSTVLNPHPTNLAELGITFYDIDATDTIPAVKNALQINPTILPTMLSSKFNDVKNVFQFNAYSSDSNFLITKTSTSLNVTQFSINLDTTRQVGDQARLTYIDPVTNTSVTIDATYTLNANSTVTGAITLEAGSAKLVGTRNAISTPLDGLNIIYTGASTATTSTINLTQGIADRIYNLTNNITDPDMGVIQNVINDCLSDIDNKNSKITRLNEQLKDEREKMLKQFADVEKAISDANSILQMIEANDHAKRER